MPEYASKEAANLEADIRKLFLNLAESKVGENDHELQLHARWRARFGAKAQALPAHRHVRLQSDSHIRLLVLQPGTVVEEIKCELRQVKIDARNPDITKPFTALSYAWGASNVRLPIECDGACVKVTPNLYSALLRLRLRDEEKEKVLWVDALCIDQSVEPQALEERAHQVRMMGHIYSMAAGGVIVDLGGSGRQNLLTLLNFFARSPSIVVRNRLGDPSWAETPERMTRELKTLHDDVHTMNLLLTRPWFKRAWVVQEFALAKKVVLMIGSTRWDLQTFERVIRSAYTFKTLDAPVLSPKFSQWRGGAELDPNIMGSDKLRFAKMVQECAINHIAWSNFIHVRHQAQERKDSESKFQFVALLDLSRQLRATDKRDHIYAILGLLEPKEASSITVSYSKTDAELSLEIGKILVRSGLGAYCIHQAEGINATRPSWAPALQSDPVGVVSNALLNVSLLHRGFNACGKTDASIEFVEDRQMLAVRAARVDRIDALALPSSLNPPRINHDLLKQWYPYIKRWTIDNFSTWDDLQRHDTLSRTLRLNCMPQPGKFDGSTRPYIPIPSDQVPATYSLEMVLQLAERDPAAWYTPGPHTALMEDIFNRCYGRKLCHTSQGRMAFVPAKSVHGNEIWIIAGVAMPYVFRWIGVGYVVVGPCYVHGMMNGEALESENLHFETMYLK